MKRRFIYIILILSIMMYTFGSNTLSWFMNTTASEDNIFTVGTLDIGIGEDSIGQIDIDSLLPDQAVEQRIKIVNKGTLDCKLYGIRFPNNSLNLLSDLEDALDFHIYFTSREDKEITALDIPVFYNYVNTIKEDLIIFYPIIVDEEITMVFRAELDLMEIEDKHSQAKGSTIEFEILAAQLDTPLDELSERYKLSEDYTGIQDAINDLEDADVLVVGEGQYECDGLLIEDKRNICIAGIGQESIPEFRYIEDHNNNKRVNTDLYFLRVENCSGTIIRSIALGYYKENSILSNEIYDKGPKPKKPLYIDEYFNQININLQGEFKENQPTDEGSNNIIFMN